MAECPKTGTPIALCEAQVALVGMLSRSGPTLLTSFWGGRWTLGQSHPPGCTIWACSSPCQGRGNPLPLAPQSTLLPQMLPGRTWSTLTATGAIHCMRTRGGAGSGGGGGGASGGRTSKGGMTLCIHTLPGRFLGQLSLVDSAWSTPLGQLSLADSA